MELTDKELIERCLAGKSDYFRYLIQRYQKPLFAYLMRKLRDKTKATEASQEAFVRSYTGLARLKNPEGFNSWLLGIATNVCLEFYRANRREMETIGEIDEFTGKSTENLEDIGLEEILAELPEVQRRVILLRYYENHSCNQIAEALNMPLGTVTKNLSRAYSTLRQKLKDDSPEVVEELA